MNNDQLSMNIVHLITPPLMKKKTSGQMNNIQLLFIEHRSFPHQIIWK